MTTGPTDAFHCSCPACGAAVDVIPETALISAAEYDRRVTELLAANTAEIERRRAVEALAARMWPIVEAVAEIGAAHEFAITLFQAGMGADLICAAAALRAGREGNADAV